MKSYQGIGVEGWPNISYLADSGSNLNSKHIFWKTELIQWNLPINQAHVVLSKGQVVQKLEHQNLFLIELSLILRVYPFLSICQINQLISFESSPLLLCQCSCYKIRTVPTVPEGSPGTASFMLLAWLLGRKKLSFLLTFWIAMTFVIILLSTLSI